MGEAKGGKQLEATTKTWEYLVIRHGVDFDFTQFDDSEELLFNRLGEEGWEIITCLDGIGGHISRVILKRPKQQ